MAIPDSVDIGALITKREEQPIRLGQFSDIFTSKFSKGRDGIVCVKVLRGARDDNRVTSELRENLLKHARVWVTLKHPNIVQFYGLAFDCGPLPALIMDYYPIGNAFEYLKKRSLSPIQRVELLRDVASGLNYLHNLNPPIVHGDIRAANILVDGDFHGSIVDYELAFIINTSDFTTYKTAGAARWIAPELISSVDDDDYQGPEYTTHSDIFAFGMTIIEIFTGQEPFAAVKQDFRVMRLIRDGKRPNMPQEIQEIPLLTKLIEDCWHAESSFRPTSWETVIQLGLIMEGLRPPLSQLLLSMILSPIYRVFNVVS
ncbi:hypothetical protein AMATHDRAFT_72209 [Amanita thiersii Skay4041]|uniref:Protein kinase domain-containing protein n=1 Tax=Amanita thiersii Skay4041 TaxID=703135 RepID=A0A2A9NAH4_9AGAR|nr:hypothetical protein AMATHDRAFT_72209 [Amanita thiersii Skay4041]